MVEKIGSEAISKGVGESERGREGGNDGVKFTSEDGSFATCGLNGPLSDDSLLLSAGEVAFGSGGFLNGIPDAWACAPYSIFFKLAYPCKSDGQREERPILRRGFFYGGTFSDRD